MSDKVGAAGKGKSAKDVKPEAYKPAGEAGREIGDTIFVRDFVVDCNVGVYAEEQGVTQKVAFTVEARLAPHVHSKEDAMAEVPSYADIIDAIVDLARAGHINLVETFGERIAEGCLADPRIVAVRVRLEKLERGPLRGVEIIRPATRAAAAEFGRG
jgi:dihydroneopterin aldolase